MDRQLTRDRCGHILTNIGCWSPDGQWVVYDTRSDAAGSTFDGTCIERVHTVSGRVERLYESRNGAGCGVVTCCPVTDRVVFILGPEHPTDDWSYAAYHRRGVFVRPGDTTLTPLDAMCYAEPFVPGALRGGSHVHTFDASGEYVAFTYEDHVLAIADQRSGCELNQRNVGVSSPIKAVQVHDRHPRNHSGSHFSVLLTQTYDQPRPGSDEISRAVDDAWVGRNGYWSSQASAYQKALAFLGEILTERGERIFELFVVDVPADISLPGRDGPLAGTLERRPRPPHGAQQRRLTFTEHYPAPGLSAPRHWPRSTPDGSRIFFLMRDRQCAPQLWSISPLGGQPQQLSRVSGGVTSAFSLSADGRWIAHTANGCLCATSTESGETYALTEPRGGEFAPRPEACVFAPHDYRIAYVRRIVGAAGTWNQVCVVDANEALGSR